MRSGTTVLGCNTLTARSCTLCRAAITLWAANVPTLAIQPRAFLSLTLLTCPTVIPGHAAAPRAGRLHKALSRASGKPPPSLLQNQMGDCIVPPATQITLTQGARDLLIPQLLGNTRRAFTVSLSTLVPILGSSSPLLQRPQGLSFLKHSIRVTCSTSIRA